MSQVSMQANYGGYHPSNYFYKDDSLSRMGDRFADAIKSVPGAIREGEKWNVERNQRSAGNAVNAEARKRFLEYLTGTEKIPPEEAGMLIPFPTPDQSPEQYRRLLEDTAAHLADRLPNMRENASRHAKEREDKEMEGLVAGGDQAKEEFDGFEWASRLGGKQPAPLTPPAPLQTPAALKQKLMKEGKIPADEEYGELTGTLKNPPMDYQSAPQRPMNAISMSVMDEDADRGTPTQSIDFSDNPATVFTGEPHGFGTPQVDTPADIPPPSADFDNETFSETRRPVDQRNRFSGSFTSGNEDQWADFNKRRQDEVFQELNSKPSAPTFPRVDSAPPSNPEPQPNIPSASATGGVSMMTSEAGSAVGGARSATVNTSAPSIPGYVTVQKNQLDDRSRSRYERRISELEGQIPGLKGRFSEAERTVKYYDGSNNSNTPAAKRAREVYKEAKDDLEAAEAKLDNYYAKLSPQYEYKDVRPKVSGHGGGDRGRGDRAAIEAGKAARANEEHIIKREKEEQDRVTAAEKNVALYASKDRELKAAQDKRKAITGDGKVKKFNTKQTAALEKIDADIERLTTELGGKNKKALADAVGVREKAKLRLYSTRQEAQQLDSPSDYFQNWVSTNKREHWDDSEKMLVKAGLVSPRGEVATAKQQNGAKQGKPSVSDAVSNYKGNGSDPDIMQYLQSVGYNVGNTNHDELVDIITGIKQKVSK